MRLTLLLKLGGSFGLLAVALTGVGAFGIRELRNYNDQVSQIASVYTPAQGLVLNADRDAQQALVAERSLLSLSSGSEDFTVQLESYLENIGQVEERMTKYAELVDAEWSQTLMEQFWPLFAAWKEAATELADDLAQGGPTATGSLA